MDDFLSLLDQWNQEEKYQKIIDCLETLRNTQALDYTLTCQLARAYNNIAEAGDTERLERAVSLPPDWQVENGDKVNFYQMIPLTFEEMQFKLYHSTQELLERFTPEQLAVVDLDRPSVCGDLPKKRFAIPREELKELYQGDGPQGCIATDRIVVDGVFRPELYEAE